MWEFFCFLYLFSYFCRYDLRPHTTHFIVSYLTCRYCILIALVKWAKSVVDLDSPNEGAHTLSFKLKVLAQTKVGLHAGLNKFSIHTINLLHRYCSARVIIVSLNLSWIWGAGKWGMGYGGVVLGGGGMFSIIKQI